MRLERSNARLPPSRPPQSKLGPPLTNLTALEALCPNVPWRRIFTALHDGCADYGWEVCLCVREGGRGGG